MRQRHHMSLIDLTPMIDILFTVLLFFMLTQNIPYNTFNLDIPTTQKERSGTTMSDNIKIHIFPDDNFLAINSTKLSNIEEFQKTMKSYQNTSSVMLIVDGKSASKNLISVMEILNNLQFSQINIITKYE